ncbi:MAG: hypothetical protein U5O16_24835 [Rhodococcus sp. (in: high G+C Gram-positive bacteria)]|uniref:hypothetical protein n=1 Tax=Rhodococcus sp. TaxID=1831 RepID=UPI002ADBDE2C|nr:hypothetical protein [Rhodococcus sp. (in: high G+C Gram-positive bacteria)]
MSDSGSQRAELIVIGSRVTVIPTSGSRSPETAPQVGVVGHEHPVPEHSRGDRVHGGGGVETR